jgi:hypothetical protein
MMKNVAAAVILGLFYSDKNRDEYDESTAFKWLWVAREFKDSKAQVYLEALVKTMNKATLNQKAQPQPGCARTTYQHNGQPT